MTDLSILCVSKAERHAWPFLRQMEKLAKRLRAEFVIVADGAEAYHDLQPFPANLVQWAKGKGPSLEGILDQAVSLCTGKFVLRLDDDEACSQAMQTWLFKGEWKDIDHWSFPRVHFWGNAQSVIKTPELYPDLQTRLSIKKKSGGRTILHSGSPFGFGETAPVALEHYKFLVKTFPERKVIAERYEHAHPGFGTGPLLLPYTLPELAYKERVELVEYCTGSIPWKPVWTKHIHLVTND